MNIAWLLLIGNFALLVVNFISVFLLFIFMFKEPKYKFIDYVDENGRVVKYLQRTYEFKEILENSMVKR